MHSYSESGKLSMLVRAAQSYIWKQAKLHPRQGRNTK